MFFEIGVVENLANFTGKTLVLVSLFDKVAGKAISTVAVLETVRPRTKNICEALA